MRYVSPTVIHLVGERLSSSIEVSKLARYTMSPIQPFEGSILKDTTSSPEDGGGEEQKQYWVRKT